MSNHTPALTVLTPLLPGADLWPAIRAVTAAQPQSASFNRVMPLLLCWCSRTAALQLSPPLRQIASFRVTCCRRGRGRAVLHVHRHILTAGVSSFAPVGSRSRVLSRFQRVLPPLSDSSAARSDMPSGGCRFSLGFFHTMCAERSTSRFCGSAPCVKTVLSCRTVCLEHVRLRLCIRSQCHPDTGDSFKGHIHGAAVPLL
jgi:hypothetical protein